MANRTHGPLNASQLKSTVDQFNRNFPVGSKVILRKDSGEIVTTVVAPAEVLMGHSAVGWFDGVSGAYSIEGGRVRAVRELSALNLDWREMSVADEVIDAGIYQEFERQSEQDPYCW